VLPTVIVSLVGKVSSWLQAHSGSTLSRLSRRVAWGCCQPHKPPKNRACDFHRTRLKHFQGRSLWEDPAVCIIRQNRRSPCLASTRPFPVLEVWPPGRIVRVSLCPDLRMSDDGDAIRMEQLIQPFHSMSYNFT
jgi:hypothetical protein